MDDVPPSELTVAVQVVFATVSDDGVLVDCMVAEEVSTVSGRRIRPGVPFSLMIDRMVGESSMAQATAVLDRWSRSSVIVQATTSSGSGLLVLRHDHEELVLQLD